MAKTLARQEKKPKGYSQATSGDANQLMFQLGLQEVNGNDLSPVLTSSAAHIEPFDFSLFSNEDAGLSQFMQYHEAQLCQQQVVFGREGYKMYDIHSQQRQWSIVNNRGQALSGSADSCVAAFGLTGTSAAHRTPLVYEHKQNEQQKADYRAQHPKAPEVS